MGRMELAPDDFRDPAALIDEVAGRVGLVDGSVYAVLVSQPSTCQKVVCIDAIRAPAEILDHRDASDELGEVIDSWTIPESRRPTHNWVLVIVRTGWCVFGPNEKEWFMAQRYANHRQSIYSGSAILVTEHGWTDFMTQYAGEWPHLVPE
jgi:hypothetical protein